ncbi:GGDEF domain-containing protein [Nocardia sp. NPDC051570]|uniref:GGDEF domain-containing protein n=1 Tax=Nocardia sp. NPDC051570 TaxID=3364324 RepID=UPI0037A2AD26
MFEAFPSLKAWWRDSADYYWLVHTLVSHSALRWMRLIMASGGVLMAAIGIVTVLSPYGPQSGFGMTVDLIVIGFAVFWAFRWGLLPWPSATESLVLIGGADFAIAVTCAQATDRVYGATGLTLLVVTGGYLTFFHSAKVLALHTFWSLLWVLLLSVRMVIEGNDAYAAIGVDLTSVATIAVVLPMLQMAYWLLRTESRSDPLTTLVNRRGLEYQLVKMLQGDPPVGVISLDLDRFKTVNDTFGHHIGDEVLVRTAQRLRDAAQPHAVVARVGGEEFVVIGHMCAATAWVEAERLRGAVSESNEPAITASVGVAVYDGSGTSALHRLTADYLLNCADNAMYEAKRCGGNLVVLDELTVNETGPVSHQKVSGTGPAAKSGIRMRLRPAP